MSALVYIYPTPLLGIYIFYGQHLSITFEVQAIEGECKLARLSRTVIYIYRNVRA